MVLEGGGWRHGGHLVFAFDQACGGREWMRMPSQFGSPPGASNIGDHRPLARIVIIWPI